MLAGQSVDSSAEKAITAVQSFLRSSESTPPLLAVTGTWNGETQSELASFTLHLQNHAVLGLPWQGPKDGEFSAEYADYLQQAIDQAKSSDNDPQEVAGLKTFLKAMNILRRKGVYVASAQSSDSAETASLQQSEAVGSTTRPESGTT